jgi:hypothetical protein
MTNLDNSAARPRKQVPEEEAWRKHRALQQLPRTTFSISPRDTSTARVGRAEAWKDAVKIIDATEPEVRDIIERGLAFRAATYGERMLQVMSVVDQVATVRIKAFKKAFRLVRTRGV